jgi:hypothetical protein
MNGFYLFIQVFVLSILKPIFSLLLFSGGAVIKVIQMLRTIGHMNVQYYLSPWLSDHLYFKKKKQKTKNLKLKKKKKPSLW